MTAYQLTTSPTDVMLAPSCSLVVGVENAEDGTRAYLGARYRGVYVVVHGEDAAELRRAWALSTRTHLWLVPAPPAHVLQGGDRTLSAPPEETS